MSSSFDFDDYDVSNCSFINTIWIVKDGSYVVSVATVFLPLVLLGVYGNFLVIYVTFKNFHIRTPTNLLIGNMAAADLLSLLFHPWMFLTYDIFQNYQLGPIGCRVEGTIECSVILTSVISMTAITYDRLTAILLPKETRLTMRGSKIVICSTWLAGILISVPLAYYRNFKVRQWLNYVETYCYENTVVTSIYWYVIITVLVWIPLSIQIICYISIFIKLNKYEKVILRKFQHHQVGYKTRAAKMMFIVTLTFMICHLPFTAFIIYRHNLLKTKGMENINPVNYKNQVKGTYHTLWFTSRYLIYLNGVLNPLIYGVTNERYRKEFKKSKLSKWLFPRRLNKTVVIKEKKQKTMETGSNDNIFFIFKKKKKNYRTNYTTSNTPIGSGTKIINTRL